MAFKNLSSKDKSELREIIDQMTAVSVDSFEKVEDAISHGCPRGPFMALVNLKTDNDAASNEPMLSNIKKQVEQKLGDGAFDEKEVLSIVDSLVRNNRDLVHFRRLVRGFNVSAFVVNKIVEIRTRSPLDSGGALFEELFQVEGVETDVAEVQSGEAEAVTTTTRPEKKRLISSERKQLLVDVALGIGLGVSAIALLV